MTDFRFICVRFILFILDLKILSVTERHSGESDSIDHTFIHCHFTKKFIGSVIQWFNDSNNTYFSPYD